MKTRILIMASSLFLFTLFFIANASSDQPEQSLLQYIHDAWQTDQGLPQNSVFTIVQTRDGYIWLATQEGLVRFDGIRFTVFDKRNTPQMKENNVQALYEDSEGSLWAGTEGGGLIRLKNGEFTAYTKEQGLADNIVDAICEDGAGNLWVGTLGGLSRLKDGEFTNYTTTNGLPNDTVLSVLADRAGNLWIGTDEGGLCRLKDERFSVYTTKDGLADDLVRAVYEDSGGTLWIATRAGLSMFKDGKFTTFTKKDGLADDSIFSIYEDREGKLWIATRGGLVKRAGGKFISYTTKDGLTEDHILSICEDREGNLWVGTYEGGLNRFKQGRFVVYTSKEGLADDIVRPVYEDSSGSMWIGTASGLNRLKDGQFTKYTAREGLADDSVVALSEDKQGNLWIGTGGGLSRMSKGKITSYTTKNGLSDNTVLSIYPGRDGSLWIGTASGLNRLKDEKITYYTTRDGLTNDSIWSLYEDAEGALWIGTDGGGLNRFKDGAFTALTTKDGLVNDIVLSIHADAEGSLWIGTSGGLSRLKAGKLGSYTTNDGLFDDVVFQILEDERGNLWMSCNKGIFRAGKSELESFAAGKTRRINCVSYGTADGLKSRECNGGFQPAGWRARDGRLWFPTIKGVAVIDPEAIKVNNLPPPVMIEQVLVDHEPILLSGSAELPPGKSKFEFHFTGLSFIAPEKVRFKYRLEGFDRDWVDGGGRRETAYTNIPPGNYTFRVIASNNDGVWNETGAAFHFYLKPYFYQTYWFYGVCAIVAGLAALAVYRLRVRQIQSRFAAVLEERNRIAREIHDTLAQGFAGISLQLEAVDETLTDSPGVAREHLNRARNLVRSSIAEARRSVWDLRSPALTSTDLAGALAAVCHQLTAGTSLEARVKTKGAVRRLAPEVETNLLHIGREALTNAVKHARAGHIIAELKYDNETVSLAVKDDGCGFEPDRAAAESGGGFGLVSIKERAEQIGARLSVQSAREGGTEIRVEVSK